MRLKEKNLLQKFAATLKKLSAQGAKKVDYGMHIYIQKYFIIIVCHMSFRDRMVIYDGQLTKDSTF